MQKECGTAGEATNSFCSQEERDLAALHYHHARQLRSASDKHDRLAQEREDHGTAAYDQVALKKYSAGSDQFAEKSHCSR